MKLVVSRLSKLSKRKFGRLTTREFPLRKAFGDLSFVYERLPPRVQMPAIRHRRTAELVFCTKGSMTAFLGGKKFKIGAGGVVLIPAGVSHRFVTRGRACEAISLFHPGLSVGPGADIVLEDQSLQRNGVKRLFRAAPGARRAGNRSSKKA